MNSNTTKCRCRRDPVIPVKSLSPMNCPRSTRSPRADRRAVPCQVQIPGFAAVGMRDLDGVRVIDVMVAVDVLLLHPAHHPSARRQHARADGHVEVVGEPVEIVVETVAVRLRKRSCRADVVRECIFGRGRVRAHRARAVRLRRRRGAGCLTPGHRGQHHGSQQSKADEPSAIGVPFSAIAL